MIPMNPKPLSEPHAVASRGGRVVRWLLYMIAVLSGLVFVVSPLACSANHARNSDELHVMEYRDDVQGIAKATEKMRRDDDEAYQNTRTAIIVLTVALAALAASRR
jgi:hypothetical protein